MIQPVALADFFLSFFSGAMIILVAALYAGLYAWAQMSRRDSLHKWASLTYGLLLAFVALFSQVNHLNGHWLTLVVLMAIGYWWMPRLIWRLCAATHADETEH